MSKFLSKRYEMLTPYTPGEQPAELAKVIKLNTNESPYPPHEDVAKAAEESAKGLQVYSKPEWTELKEELGKIYGLKPEQVFLSNGSDEALNFAFMVFADEERPLVFPDVTYGFYKVFAQLNRIPYEEIPVTKDFAINPEDYTRAGRVAVIANPNSPTGRYLPLAEIERIAKANPENILIVDEAYVDFGGDSAVSLIDKYENLLVTRTFSKSGSLAGGRLGIALGNTQLIGDLNTIKYSTNPYNVNSTTAAAGLATVKNADYYRNNCHQIAKTREAVDKRLKEFGFNTIESKANFIFAKPPGVSGEELYIKLRDRGVLVRHFGDKKLTDYLRISIGTDEQMERFLRITEEILREAQNEKVGNNA